MSAGKVHLVGAGPGDPRLITVRGKELIERADVLVYDALIGSALLEWAPTSCEKIFVGKRAGNHAMAQEEINGTLVRLAREGKQVVRLKGGDPFIYGRGAEEAMACHQAGVDFEVVPGVTSAFAAPASAGIPVLHRTMAGSVLVLHGRMRKRDSEVAAVAKEAPPEPAEADSISDSAEIRRGGIVVRKRRTDLRKTASIRLPASSDAINVDFSDDPEDRPDAGADDLALGTIDWKAACAAADTLVFLMAAGRLHEIRAGLLEGGRPPDQPVALVHWGTMPMQRTIVSTVDKFPKLAEASGLGSPLIVVVGEVVKLRQQLNTFETRPLFGWRVCFAEGGAMHTAFADALADAGAMPMLVPVALPAPLGETRDEIAAAAAAFDHATHVLVTGYDLVEALLRGALLCGLDTDRLLSGKILLTTTPETAEAFKVFGYEARSIGSKLSDIAAVEKQFGRLLSDCRVLVLEHEDEWFEGTDHLEEAGAEVHSLPLSNFVPHEVGIRKLSEMLAEGGVDAIFLASPEAAEILRRGVGEGSFASSLRSTVVIAADEHTAQLLKDWGLAVHVHNGSESPEKLVHRLVNFRSVLGGQKTVVSSSVRLPSAKAKATGG